MSPLLHHDYLYQSLHLRSFVALEALQGSELAGHADAEPDLSVLLGLPPRGRDLVPGVGGWLAGDDAFAFDIPDVGRLTVLDGREIHISALTDAQLPLLEQFICGTAFAVAQMQRGRFSLHGAVLARGGRTIAFCGDSGEGKSTLAMALSAAGWQSLTDDLALVQPQDGVIMVENNGRHLRLWAESLDALGYSKQGLTRISPHEDKYYIRAPLEARQARARLDAICFLESGAADEDFALTPVTGMPALALLRRHTYRQELIGALKCDRPHLAHCVAVASAVPLLRFRRPRDLGRVPEMVAFVDQRLGGGG